MANKDINPYNADDLLSYLKDKNFLAIFEPKKKETLQFIYNQTLFIGFQRIHQKPPILDFTTCNLKELHITVLQLLYYKGNPSNLAEITSFIGKLDIFNTTVNGDFLKNNHGWDEIKSSIESSYLNKKLKIITPNKKIKV